MKRIWPARQWSTISVSRWPEIDHLLLDADFGRSTVDKWALILATKARWMLLAFILGVLVLQGATTPNPWPFVGLGVGYVLYFSLQPRTMARYAQLIPDRAYLTRFVFSLLLLGWVLAFLLLLVSQNQPFDVGWFLLLPALCEISYYRRQRIFLAVLTGTTLLVSWFWWIETGQSSMSVTGRMSAVAENAAAVFGVSYLIHYFIQAARVEESGAQLQSGLLSHLIDLMASGADSDTLWLGLRDVCARSVRARKSAIYRWDHRTHSFTVVLDEGGSNWAPTLPKALGDRFLAPARDWTYQSAFMVSRSSTDSHVYHIAALIPGHVPPGIAPVGLVILEVEISRSDEFESALRFLFDLLAETVPYASYASTRLTTEAIHRLDLEEVSDQVCSALIDRFGANDAHILVRRHGKLEVIGTRASDSRPSPGVLHIHSEILDAVMDQKVSRIVSDTAGPPGSWLLLPLTGKRLEGLIAIDLALSAGDLQQTRKSLSNTRWKSDSGIPAMAPVLDKLIAKTHTDTFIEFSRNSATIALENALLFANATDIHNHIDALYGLPGDHHEHTEESVLLERIVSTAHRAFAVDTAIIWPVVDDADPEDEQIHYGVPVTAGLPLQTRHLVERVDRRAPFVEEMDGQIARGQLLLRAGREPIGMLFLIYSKTTWIDERLLEIFANRAAMILGDRRIVVAEEGDRIRRSMIQNLHDGVKNTIHGAKIRADGTRRDHYGNAGILNAELAEVSEACTEALLHLEELFYSNVDSHRVAHHEPSLYLGRVIEFLERSINGQEIACHTHLDDNLPALPPRLTIASGLFLNEAVSNAVRHASATAIWIHVYLDEKTLVLEVRDDGKGMPPNHQPLPHQLGLCGLRQRFDHWDGQVAIGPASHPVSGTLVIAHIQLPL